MIAIFVSSIWQYSQSRSSCCSKEDRRGGSLSPDVAATTAEQNSQVHVRCDPHNIACFSQHTVAGQVVLCPAEAPHKTKYRSTSGLVTCGQRMVGKCLCLDPDQPQVIGCHLSHCHVTPILISDWLSRCHVTSILTCDWCRDPGRGGRWAQWRAISATARWVMACHGFGDVIIINLPRRRSGATTAAPAWW